MTPNKGLSIGLCVCLLGAGGGAGEVLAYTVSGVQAARAVPALALVPPSSLGHISDFCPSDVQTESPFVVLIQDLHAHYGVQKNIAGLLEFLTSRLSSPGVTTRELPFVLAVEGASGPIDSSIMALYPDGPEKRRALEFLLRQGELTGMEYFAVRRGLAKSLYGVEDRRLYETHRELFRRSYLARQELITQLTALQSQISNAGRSLFPPTAMTWRHQWEKVLDGRLALPSYLGAARQAWRGTVSFETAWPTLSDYARRATGNNPSPETLRALVQEFLRKAGAALEPSEKSRLEAFERLGDPLPFWLTLRELIYQKRLFLAVPPELGRHLEQIAFDHSQRMSRVYQEGRDLSFSLARQETSSEQANAFLKLEQELDPLIKVLNQQAGEPDVKRLGRRLNDVIAMADRLLGTDRPQPLTGERLRELISSSIDFYVMAHVRDAPLLDRTLARVAEEPRSTRATAPATAVLVTGGFHTAAITEALRQRRIGYVVWTPNVDRVTDKDHALYVSRLRGIGVSAQDMWVDIAGAGFARRASASDVLSARAHSLAAGRFGSLVGLRFLDYVELLWRHKERLTPAQVDIRLAQRYPSNPPELLYQRSVMMHSDHAHYSHGEPVEAPGVEETRASELPLGNGRTLTLKIPELHWMQMSDAGWAPETLGPLLAEALRLRVGGPGGLTQEALDAYLNSPRDLFVGLWDTSSRLWSTARNTEGAFFNRGLLALKSDPSTSAIADIHFVLGLSHEIEHLILRRGQDIEPALAQEDARVWSSLMRSAAEAEGKRPSMFVVAFHEATQGLFADATRGFYALSRRQDVLRQRRARAQEKADLAEVKKAALQQEETQKQQTLRQMEIDWRRLAEEIQNAENPESPAVASQQARLEKLRAGAAKHRSDGASIAADQFDALIQGIERNIQKLRDQKLAHAVKLREQSDVLKKEQAGVSAELNEIQEALRASQRLIDRASILAGLASALERTLPTVMAGLNLSEGLGQQVAPASRAEPSLKTWPEASEITALRERFAETLAGKIPPTMAQWVLLWTLAQLGFNDEFLKSVFANDQNRAVIRVRMDSDVALKATLLRERVALIKSAVDDIQALAPKVLNVSTTRIQTRVALVHRNSPGEKLRAKTFQSSLFDGEDNLSFDDAALASFQHYELTPTEKLLVGALLKAGLSEANLQKNLFSSPNTRSDILKGVATKMVDHFELVGRLLATQVDDIREVHPRVFRTTEQRLIVSLQQLKRLYPERPIPATQVIWACNRNPRLLSVWIGVCLLGKASGDSIPYHELDSVTRAAREASLPAPKDILESYDNTPEGNAKAAKDILALYRRTRALASPFPEAEQQVLIEASQEPPPTQQNRYAAVETSPLPERRKVSLMSTTAEKLARVKTLVNALPSPESAVGQRRARADLWAEALGYDLGILEGLMAHAASLSLSFQSLDHLLDVTDRLIQTFAGQSPSLAERLSSTDPKFRGPLNADIEHWMQRWIEIQPASESVLPTEEPQEEEALRPNGLPHGSIVKAADLPALVIEGAPVTPPEPVTPSLPTMNPVQKRPAERTPDFYFPPTPVTGPAYSHFPIGNHPIQETDWAELGETLSRRGLISDPPETYQLEVMADMQRSQHPVVLVYFLNLFDEMTDTDPDATPITLTGLRQLYGVVENMINDPRGPVHASNFDLRHAVIAGQAVEGPILAVFENALKYVQSTMVPKDIETELTSLEGRIQRIETDLFSAERALANQDDVHGAALVSSVSQAMQILIYGGVPEEGKPPLMGIYATQERLSQIKNGNGAASKFSGLYERAIAFEDRLTGIRNSLNSPPIRLRVLRRELKNIEKEYRRALPIALESASIDEFVKTADQLLSKSKPWVNESEELYLRTLEDPSLNDLEESALRVNQPLEAIQQLLASSRDFWIAQYVGRRLVNGLTNGSISEADLQVIANPNVSETRRLGPMLALVHRIFKDRPFLEPHRNTVMQTVESFARAFYALTAEQRRNLLSAPAQTPAVSIIGAYNARLRDEGLAVAPLNPREPTELLLMLQTPMFAAALTTSFNTSDELVVDDASALAYMVRTDLELYRLIAGYAPAALVVVRPPDLDPEPNPEMRTWERETLHLLSEKLQFDLERGGIPTYDEVKRKIHAMPEESQRVQLSNSLLTTKFATWSKHRRRHSNLIGQLSLLRFGDALDNLLATIAWVAHRIGFALGINEGVDLDDGVAHELKAHFAGQGKSVVFLPFRPGPWVSDASFVALDEHTVGITINPFLPRLAILKRAVHESNHELFGRMKHKSQRYQELLQKPIVGPWLAEAYEERWVTRRTERQLLASARRLAENAQRAAESIHDTAPATRPTLRDLTSRLLENLLRRQPGLTPKQLAIDVRRQAFLGAA